ncbi:MAG TPA: hypothetical protein VFA92_02325, partial [Candidatus Binatia bacterium]|nr:hypothetical protein [Candidatus Binatia bacterium]
DAADRLLPPQLGGPVELLELGRATRDVSQGCAAPWPCATAAAPPRLRPAPSLDRRPPPGPAGAPDGPRPT